MAEKLFEKHAKENSLSAHASSAGLIAFCGDTASDNSQAVMKELGLSLENHRSKKLTLYDLQENDFIVPMTASIASFLSDYCKEKVIAPKKSISDPYGKDIEEYRKCRDEIDAFIKEIIEIIKDTDISPMKKEDVFEISIIEKECFSKPWSKEAIEAELQNETAYFFIAKKLNSICGYIGMHIVIDECYIANIAVSPKWHRNGIGCALLQHAIKTAKNKNASFISLEVRKSNKAAISLYEKFGFTIRGERKNFYCDPCENALIMTKDF